MIEAQRADHLSQTPPADLPLYEEEDRSESRRYCEIPGCRPTPFDDLLSPVSPLWIDAAQQAVQANFASDSYAVAAYILLRSVRCRMVPNETMSRRYRRHYETRSGVFMRFKHCTGWTVICRRCNSYIHGYVPSGPVEDTCCCPSCYDCSATELSYGGHLAENCVQCFSGCSNLCPFYSANKVIHVGKRFGSFWDKL